MINGRSRFISPRQLEYYPAAAPKPALHLVGTTGSGKSEIAALMSSFYGSFTRDLPPAQWGDTVNTVEALGYSLADALYWVDDYKAIYADERTFTRFLQSYSRGMGRGRLTREAKLRQERPCRGLLLSTGETTLEGEASVLARMLVLDIPPWERRDPGGTLPRAGRDRCVRSFPRFTAAFIQWIAVAGRCGSAAQTTGRQLRRQRQRLSDPPQSDQRTSTECRARRPELGGAADRLQSAARVPDRAEVGHGAAAVA